MIAADRRWFRPGMQIKRWIALLILGISMISLGIGYILVSFYRNAPLPDIFYWLTLQFIDREIRGLVFISAGIALTIFSIVQINRSLLQPFLENTGDDKLVDIIYRERALGSGPTIVCLGGGPGLSIIMRGLKNETANLWGITLAHGPARTKSELGLLEGHVLPASTDQLVMSATLRDGTIVEGENAIMARRSGPAIDRLSMRRTDGGVPEANPDAVKAIEKADVIVLGPADLWCSLVPVLLVPDIAEAVRRSEARKVFICNIMTQAGKTTGFSVSDHIQALRSAGVPVDYVIVNNRKPPIKLEEAYQEKKQSEVVFDPHGASEITNITFASTTEDFVLVEGAFMVERDLLVQMGEELYVDAQGRQTHRTLTVIRHDPEKLGKAISELLQTESWRLKAN